jgi:hypothetical protein
LLLCNSGSCCASLVLLPLRLWTPGSHAAVSRRCSCWVSAVLQRCAARRRSRSWSWSSRKQRCAPRAACELEMLLMLAGVHQCCNVHDLTLTRWFV